MHYWTRDFVNERLRLSPRQSYRIVSATASGMIRSDAVLALLNAARRSMSEPLASLPDIGTAEEAAAGMGVSAAQVMRWTRRSRDAMPSLRLNRSTTRIPLALANAWLARQSLPHGARAGRRCA